MNAFARYSRAAALGSASILALAAYSTAHAQQSQSADAKSKSADTMNEIVVTGFRASLQSALNAKRTAILPIESVAPEDIGKMPDQNVSESLQRLPGVQIDRGPQGEGTAVLIDGLRQNLTTLNGDVFLTGKEFYVSGEGSGGGAGGNNQYSSLEGIPSEEIGGIDVYKNPKASMTEGGLGGTIDLKTRDPLAGPTGLSIGGNVRAAYNDTQGASAQYGGWTPVGTLVGTYKFSDRFAVTGSISYDEENTHTREFEDQNRNQWLITDSMQGSYTGPTTAADLAHSGTFYIDPQLAYMSDIYDQRKTLGASVGLKFRLNDAITTSLLWFYSKEDDTTSTYSDKVWFNGEGQSPGSLLPGIDSTQPFSIDSHGVVQSGTFQANGAETATLWQHALAEANNFQWVTTYDNGGPLRGALDLSYARAQSNLQADQADVEHGLYESYPNNAPTSPAAPGCNNGGATCGSDPAASHGYEFAWTNGGDSGLPSVKYLAPFADILSNPNYTTFKSNWAWANYAKEKQFAGKGDVSYDVPFLSEVGATLSGGVRVATRDVDQTFGRYLINGDYNGNTTGNCCIGAGSGTYLYYQDPGYAAIPFSTAVSNPGLVKVVNNFGAGPMIVKNTATMTDPSTYLEKVWAGGGVTNNTEAFFVDTLSSFKVKETTSAGYVMADLGGKGARYHVNFGLRLVDTDLTIDNAQTAASPTYYGTASWNGVNSNNVPVQHKRNYIDVLPSFNFTLDVTDNQIVRFGAARVVAPQDLFALGLGNSYNFTRGANDPVTGNARFQFAGGSSGNPNLDPYRASQFNVSWEDYFAKGALISVAGFYKQVDNFVETENIPTKVNDDFGGTTADVTQPVNAGKGSIYGVEIGGQYAFNGDWMPWLQGFGVAGNYTRSMSFSDQATSFSEQGPIPGVAKNAVTVQGYYERGGFAARLSYSWRDTAVNDSLVGATFAFPDQNGKTKVYQVFSAAYGQLDGQISYDINKRIGVVFSVQNLTDEVQHTYLQWPNLPFTYDDSGRRYFLGVKFKL
ncbi:TonB-dependent receptor [Phenylobacterium montanum]|uniref:TonB-dependent receptor n=1 Tax=Phenylobacterium montanum TaxID=2823693 RepID=A0A975IX09_9CAUL|nr:TonB-dependent receptor [Caulobacter sp. S6]QUD88921.1 TonB-dependent receptor [Caulobacter sp. S6]